MASNNHGRDDEIMITGSGISKKISFDSFYGWAEEQCLGEQEMQMFHYPRPHHSVSGKAVVYNIPHKYFRSVVSPYERFCRFCFKKYSLDQNGNQKGFGTCYYHPYRRPPPSERYPCCGQNRMAGPCANRDFHCTEDIDVDKLEGFIDSQYLKNTSKAIYALDCEFVQMKSGLALAQTIIIDFKEEIVMNCIVMPPEPIVDYLTRYSGLTEEDFKENCLTESEFQAKLSKFLGPNTILIGHSLQSDLLKMKAIHHKVIDTARIYKHPDGAQFSLSLKVLAKKYLTEKENSHFSDIPKAQMDSIKAYRLVKQFGLKSNFARKCNQ